MAEWEARSKLVYGSKHQGYFANRELAERFAKEQIEAEGGVGTITLADRATHVVYYDTCHDDG